MELVKYNIKVLGVYAHLYAMMILMEKQNN